MDTATMDRYTPDPHARDPHAGGVRPVDAPPASHGPAGLKRRDALRLSAAGGVAAFGGPLLLGSPAAAASSLAGAPEVVLPRATDAVTPFRAHVPEATLVDLRRRLADIRWPDAATTPGWAQGVPLERARRLAHDWLHGYDWRRGESALNAFPQYRTRIDGLGIHFLHVRSRHPNALPIVLTHGWPGSVFEQIKLIDPLVNPTRYGAPASQAFHVVVPSLPGFGFSDKPTVTGWGVDRTAHAWQVLMERLGYTRYVAAGGDWGSGVTHALAKLRPSALAGMHTNFPTYLFDPPVSDQPDAEEREALAQLNQFSSDGIGYLRQMTTRPQTIGYGLEDSPIGLGTWIYEKLAAWTDSDHGPEQALGRDAVLDDITLYWVTGTAASAARFYWENPVTTRPDLDLPVGVTVFPREIITSPRVWAERCYHNLIRFNQVGRGGHFPAWEVPRLMARELRATFDPLR